MATWHDDKLLELASQLTYSPADKRREQMLLAIALLPAIDPAKTYPWDFVHFRVTGFQPRSHIEHTLPGKILRADLATLIEFLSDTLAIPVSEAGSVGAAPGDSVLLLDDVTRKFNVSDKTIQRWRKQGLIALRYVYPDGRRRLGFLDSAVTQFAAANKDRVDRSANFRQITDDEKKKIIEVARFLATQHRLCIKEVARHIAHQLKRSPEAIRYTIRNYDLEHPEAAIFPDPTDQPQRRPTPISPPTLPLFPPEIAPIAPSAAPAVPTPQENARRLKALKIEYMHNPLFDHPDADAIILNVLPTEALAHAQATVNAGTNAKSADVYMARIPRDLPAFLQDIFRQPVMPHELETDAFRRMNYLNYRAAQLQKSLIVETATPDQITAIETLLAQAAETKNLIVQANLRVAVHVARKHQRPDRPLMELVSDATIWLMRAADKFDFARTGGGGGARFSTYASFAVMKNFARDRVEQLTRRDTNVLTGQQEVLNTLGDRESAAAGEHLDTATLQNDLLTVIQELPQRERELLTHHYGLDQTKPALSLAQIGDKMGITKARVMQLEAKALRKLRHLLETRREKLHKATAK